MALETTNNYQANNDDKLTELPASETAYAVIPVSVVGRKVQGKRRIFEVRFRCIHGRCKGLQHDETYFIDDKEGNPAAVPRAIMANLVRCCADGDGAIDWDIDRTIAAHILGRGLSIEIKDSTQYGLQVRRYIAPGNRTAAQTAAATDDEWATLEDRRLGYFAALAEYQNTGKWPTNAPKAPKPSDDFIDDAIPF
jgi:hypothetical protein